MTSPDCCPRYLRPSSMAIRACCVHTKDSRYHYFMFVSVVAPEPTGCNQSAFWPIRMFENRDSGLICVSQVSSSDVPRALDARAHHGKNLRPMILLLSPVSRSRCVSDVMRWTFCSPPRKNTAQQPTTTKNIPHSSLLSSRDYITVSFVLID
jgi:hypothetical protein